MALQIYSWYASFPAWNETSFDHIRDFNQPPPPGVDYQQYNVSTRLPIQSSYNNPVSSIYTSQLPYTSQQLYENTSYVDYSMISPRNNETTNDPIVDLSNSDILFQPELYSSSSEYYCDPKSNKLRKRKGKKKKAVVGLNSKIKNQSSNCTINNNKSKRKKKNVPDDGEDQSIVQNKRESVQKFYRGKKSGELKVRPIKDVKKDLSDNIIRLNFSFSNDKQPLRNDISTCAAMRLPLEILVKIVEYSTAETTLALMLTCQKWYNWLTDEQSPKNEVREMIHTIQKMKPKPGWYFECDMCYKKSNVMKWKFGNILVNTCYNCKKMYEVADS
ncbi:hypothetical protein RhiirA4_398407 [Rhizophagus irregularis]|uniref:F-box domain-containing protein n=1 Tax=Rhizophagus irregularis TaxID=588596 RepID=A0A2I1G987_9GLOM|nr:hypothetical protein RhiirA4_398407 [Rhizophagus irregularis]